MLYIDFETQSPSNTFPDKKFNDAAEWNKGAQTGVLVNWVNVKHAGSGGLHQTKNTNANTTTTAAPAPANCKDWTDYTVQMTVTYDDNDSWIIVFRYKDSGNYYFFGVEQANSEGGGVSPIARLLKAPAADGNQNGALIAETQMPGVKIKRGAATDNDLAAPVETEEWVIRVEATGNQMKCYFFPRKDIKNLGDKVPNPPLLEAEDNANPKGCVGIRNDTIVGTIDDFLVFGPEGSELAVATKGKLAVTWGDIKAATDQDWRPSTK
jgi:hypothetical protein